MKISLRAGGLTGDKMWNAEVTPQGVTIRFGSVGKKPKSQLVPLATCKNRNATDEAIKRAEAKRKSGYWDVDPEDDETPETKNAVIKPSKPKDKADLGSIKVNNWF